MFWSDFPPFPLFFAQKMLFSRCLEHKCTFLDYEGIVRFKRLSLLLKLWFYTEFSRTMQSQFLLSLQTASKAISHISHCVLITKILSKMLTKHYDDHVLNSVLYRVCESSSGGSSRGRVCYQPVHPVQVITNFKLTQNEACEVDFIRYAGQLQYENLTF